MARVLKIASHVGPTGAATADNFAVEDVPAPVVPKADLQLRLTHISVDPWYLGLIKPGLYTWCDALPVGCPMMGTCVARVAHGNAKFPTGTLVTGFLPFQTLQNHNGDGLNALAVGDGDDAAGVAVDSLSIFGGPALTAFFGLEDVAKPKAGDVVVISAAAGSVGSIAGQLCKAKGATVIGFAGTDAKCAHLREVLKFDAAINYKAADWTSQLDTALAGGKANVFWDNTSVLIAAAMYPRMADHGRVVLCGEISAYGDGAAAAADGAPTHHAVNHLILEKRLRVEEILVTEFFPRIGEAMPTLVKLRGEGQLASSPYLVAGFDNTVAAFLGLFEGKNTGKTIVVA